MSELSEREKETLALIAQGFTSAEIGVELDVSPKTAETYRARVMAKLGLHTRAALFRHAFDTGVLSTDSLVNIKSVPGYGEN